MSKSVNVEGSDDSLKQKTQPFWCRYQILGCFAITKFKMFIALDRNYYNAITSTVQHPLVASISTSHYSFCPPLASGCC